MMRGRFIGTVAGILISAVGLLMPGVSTAQSADWSITNFNSSMTIQSDGWVTADEQIVAQFNQPHHGIYRDLPVSYTTRSGQSLYTNITVESVRRNGNAEPYQVTTNAANERLQIGQADRTLTGTQQYEIAYKVRGVLSSYDTYDELYWNVTGNGWGVPIEQASATVTMAKGTVQQFSCYEGPEGATATCHAGVKSGSAVQFAATRSLEAGEGLTVAVGFPSHTVPILAGVAPKSWWQLLLQPVNIGLFGLTGLLSLAAVAWLYLKKGRDWWWRNPQMLDPHQVATLKPLGGRDSVVVEYTPPDNLPPGMLGLLKDEKADTLDVTSSIVDLASRGYLVIKQLDKSWIFGSKDYELTRTEKPADGLLAYESLLLGRLFEAGTDIKLSSLKDTFYKDLADVKDAMYEEAMDRHWFQHNPKMVRGIYWFVSIAGLVVAGYGALQAVGAQHYAVGAVLGGLTLGFLALVIASFFMSQRTATGHELYRRTKGYQLFIATAETQRQRFFEQQNLFTQALPYAMMFGLTEKFAQAMKQIGYVPPQPVWYIGVGPFNPVVFGQDMGNVSKALSSTMASAPSSAGSGGGGFSGGGFGGGGGGAW